MGSNKLFSIVLLSCLSGYLFGQAGMAPEIKKSILLVNGTAHLGTGKVIEKSLIGIKDGKIAEVYNANVVDAGNLTYDSIIDISGKHIYPGFIAPNSTLGLIEIDQVRATQDAIETGGLNPNIRSISAYNTDSRITPTVRSNGVLLAQITPRGGLISGTSSIVKLDGWTWEEALFKTDDGIHINWPDYRLEDPDTDKKDKDSTTINNRRAKQVRQLREFFVNARAYLNTNFNYETNLRFEAMRKVLDASAVLYIHADHIKEMTEAVYFKREMNIQNMVIVGGYDAWRIPELLNDNKVAIILKRLHSLPVRPDESTDLPYKLPRLLDDAGVLFCLENSGHMERMETRNLPFYAGTARAYGLDEEKSIQSITLNTARILGIDKYVGSIENGKDATLFVSNGDALDIRSNLVELAFIGGRIIDLNNVQKELYLKYKKKYSETGN